MVFLVHTHRLRFNNACHGTKHVNRNASMLIKINVTIEHTEMANRTIPNPKENS